MNRHRVGAILAREVGDPETGVDCDQRRSSRSSRRSIERGTRSRSLRRFAQALRQFDGDFSGGPARQDERFQCNTECNEPSRASSFRPGLQPVCSIAVACPFAVPSRAHRPSCCGHGVRHVIWAAFGSAAGCAKFVDRHLLRLLHLVRME